MELLIVSDLHAFTPSADIKTVPSLLENSHSSVSTSAHILSSIPNVLAAEGLTVDWVLCPGDIAEKADPLAQRFAWQQLDGLKQQVGARELFATVGNHDVDSRLVHSDYDPKGSLQSLVPSFPMHDRAACDRFWSRNFFVHAERSVRLLNLNSSAFHGYHSDEIVDKSRSEYRHGRVSEYTIKSIEDELSSTGVFDYNILFMHHHPYHNDSIYPRDNSSMVFGQRLVERISQATSSGWLIIHGHQHLPQIYYGQGTAHPPVVFSAGSVSATIESPYSSIAPNQFYHVSLPTGDKKPANWEPCGYVRAWHWEMRKSWQRSSKTHQIAYGTGFGCKASPHVVSQQIATTVIANQSPYMTVDELFQVVPDLQYLLQDSMEDVINRVKASGIVYTPGDTPAEGLFRRK